MTETVSTHEPPVRAVVVSGMRPTARLHLGNLEGALRTWLSLQDDHTCYFLVADLHALTTGPSDRARLDELRREMVLDWYGAGLDPKRCTVFCQSDVPEHTELAVLLAMITPVPWLERSVTYREWLSHSSAAKPASLGLLGYPVLQAADILAYRATLVPVGRDQTQHVEMTRDIARRFGALYGGVLPLPEAVLSDFPNLPGTDGRKMSQLYGNAILVADTPDAIVTKVRTMFTDPAKVYKGDKGHPERCPVYTYHCCYSKGRTPEVHDGCRTGALGCAECKVALGEALVEALAPLRARRMQLAADDGQLASVLAEGAAQARQAAQETLALVRDAMGLRRRTVL